MRKKLIAAMMLALALGVTACSSKDTAQTTTAADTTAAQTASATVESSAAEETTETPDEDYVDGIITAIDGDIITVKNGDDETEVKYDIANAEVTKDFDLSTGDEVEVIFIEGATGVVIPALRLEVYTSVLEGMSDSTIIGVIDDAATDTLTITDEAGDTYTFKSGGAYIVSKGGVTKGTEAEVTYLGDLDEEEPAVAVKIVTEDSYDSADAKINKLSGTVVETIENGIKLETGDGSIYNLGSDGKSDLTGVKKGDKITVTYSGSLTSKSVTVTAVEK